MVDVLAWSLGGVVSLATFFLLTDPTTRTSEDRPFVIVFVGFVVIASVAGTVVSLIRWDSSRQETKRPSAPVIGVCCLLGLAVVIPCLLPATPSRNASRRTQCRNNLKQIGLALHNYYDTHDQFPLAGGDVTHSWRVAQLPYMDESALYDDYRFEEEWDSPHNVTLQSRRPAGYACPSDNYVLSEAGRRITSYVALTGSRAAFDDGRPVQIRDITDGTSHTLFIVEAAGLRRIWTEPRDANVDALPIGINRPGKQPGESHGVMSSYHTGGGHALFGDGAVRFLSQTIDAAVLQSLVTTAGGEALPAY